MHHRSRRLFSRSAQQSTYTIAKRSRATFHHRLLRCEFLEKRILLSGIPTLLKDINTSTQGSYSYESAAGDGVAIYSFDDGVHGYEPWRSDGTLEGTFMLRDIHPGIHVDGYPNSSNITDIVVANNSFFFIADDGIHGKELWTTDGTSEGTTLVADIYPWSKSSDPGSLEWFNGHLYFAATDGSLGRELWMTDGTSAGTHIVVDLAPGTDSSYPNGLTRVENTLYFDAYVEWANGLWKTDGTSDGTLLVSQSSFNTASGSEPPVIQFGTDLIFRGTDGELWKSDGTEAGTIQLKDIRPGSASSMDFTPQFTAVNGEIFFFADDGIAGLELWKTDGTTDGTVLVKDIAPGEQGQSPRSNFESMANVNGTLMFRANDGVHGDELWKSDGTEVGTVMVCDIRPGSQSSFSGTTHIVALNGSAVLWINDGETGLEPWISDGTSQGTMRIKDIYPGRNDSGWARAPARLGDSILFFADDTLHGFEMWETDGTLNGTHLIKDVNILGDDSRPMEVVAMNGDVFFSAWEWEHGRELWKSSGTTATTSLLMDIGTGIYSFYSSSIPRYLTLSGQYLFFVANDSVHGYELWRTDGTSEGTTLVMDILPGNESAFTTSPYHSPLIDVNGTLFFFANNEIGEMGLWTTTGSVENTTLVKEFSYVDISSEAASMSVINDTLFFVASDDGNGDELWKSDGTETGTMRVKDIYPGNYGSSPAYLTNVNDTLYFSAYDGTHGWELWKSDGTETGTIMIKDIWEGNIGSSPGFLTNVSGTLYFRASNGYPFGEGYELWKSDGTEAGTVLVKDICIGAGSSDLSSLTNIDGTLYFIANDGSTGAELWKSDGTEAGTVQVKDINPGIDGLYEYVVPDLTNVDGIVYFCANNGSNGSELWRSDGTEAGTMLVMDIWPGINGSFPEYLTNVDGTLYFSADDGIHGQELWILESGLSGDFDSDNDVDGDDLPIWQAGFGTVAGATLSDGDADGDGDVDGNDFLAWQLNFGNSTAFGSAANSSTGLNATEAGSGAFLSAVNSSVDPTDDTTSNPLGLVRNIVDSGQDAPIQQADRHDLSFESVDYAGWSLPQPMPKTNGSSTAWLDLPQFQLRDGYQPLQNNRAVDAVMSGLDGDGSRTYLERVHKEFQYLTLTAFTTSSYEMWTAIRTGKISLPRVTGRSVAVQDRADLEVALEELEIKPLVKAYRFMRV